MQPSGPAPQLPTDFFFLFIQPFLSPTRTLIDDNTKHDMADSKVDIPPTNDHSVVYDEDAPGPPISVPDDPADSGEGGKLRMIVQLVKKSLGVKDIAAMYVLRIHHRLSR